MQPAGAFDDEVVFLRRVSIVRAAIDENAFAVQMLDHLQSRFALRGRQRGEEGLQRLIAEEAFQERRQPAVEIGRRQAVAEILAGHQANGVGAGQDRERIRQARSALQEGVGHG